MLGRECSTCRSAGRGADEGRKLARAKKQGVQHVYKARRFAKMMRLEISEGIWLSRLSSDRMGLTYLKLRLRAGDWGRVSRDV